MKKILLSLTFVSLLMHSVEAESLTGSRPNIIIFYADDLGWQDTEINNLDKPTPWETPNVSKLASRGMLFTQGYSPAPTCAPSRGALLSGLHPAKTHLTHVSGAQLPKAKGGKSVEMIAPFYYDHFPDKTLTIAEALKTNGYRTGHVGKWHIGKHKHQSPTAEGFDFSFDGRGAHRDIGKNRTQGFATADSDDTYVLGAEKYPPFSAKNPDGIAYPKDLVTENTLKFLDESKEQPFFLYLAHWLVHYPIMTRNKLLLEHYCDKLGLPFPTKNVPVTTPGQSNPYYGAMVTTLDWSLGRIIDYLEKTDDPRNKGKKLIETTYIFFTSDNGGCEGRKTEIITDNAPLDKGKKYAQEGGVRVPMLIAGPGIEEGASFHGLINQLDYYPSILQLTNTTIPAKDAEALSGLDITPVLFGKDSSVKDAKGKSRESLFWHFPHNSRSQMQSALRKGDYKLYKNHLDSSYELYRLYKGSERVDLEEKYDLSRTPESERVVAEMSAELEILLKENDAEYPHFNPSFSGSLLGKNKVPVVKLLDFDERTRTASIQLEAGKTPLNYAYVLAEYDDGEKSYVRLEAEVSSDGHTVTAGIPKPYKRFSVVLIDKNNFIVMSHFR